MVGLNHLPSGPFLRQRRLAGHTEPALYSIRVLAHNLVRWTTRIGLGEPMATTKTLQRRFFSLAGRIIRKHAGSPCVFPTGLALAKPVQ